MQRIVPVIFAKTNNDKKTIGTINEYIFQFLANQDNPHWWNKSLVEVNSLLNDSLTGAGRNKDRRYGRPIEDMKELINIST